MNTAPAEMANKVWINSPMSNDGSPPAVLKNTKYVGALSKNADNQPVTQKYIILIKFLELSSNTSENIDKD